MIKLITYSQESQPMSIGFAAAGLTGGVDGWAVAAGVGVAA